MSEFFTAAITLLVAGVAGYLVDARWLREKRLTVYGEVLDAGYFLIEHVGQTGQATEEDRLRLLSAVSRARLIATDVTADAAAAYFTMLREALEQGAVDTVEVQRRGGAFTDAARSDLLRWPIRGWRRRTPKQDG